MKHENRGEAAAIALAVELKADLVLLDEQDGRRAAQRMGLRPLGVLGILLEAKKRGHIPVVKPLVADLRQTAGFTSVMRYTRRCCIWPKNKTKQKQRELIEPHGDGLRFQVKLVRRWFGE
jgi:hypothetical protein